MQKILQTDDSTDNQVLRKRKRKRTETVNSENANSAMDKAKRDPYSGNAFLPGESSSDDETPLAELSKEELCTKIKNLKEKLTNIRKENSRLRQSLVMLQVLPQAVTQFEELVGMAESLLKGGGVASTPASTLWRATNNSSPDSFASLCSNSNSSSSSPSSLKAEEEQHPGEKQFKIEKWQIARCNKSKPQKFINDLMQVLYTNEYMATHSLTGAKSSTSRDKIVKPAMNQNEVQEIIGITKQVFPSADDVSIRRMIGQKLNNCTKKPNVSKTLNSQDKVLHHTLSWYYTLLTTGPGATGPIHHGLKCPQLTDKVDFFSP